jgi:uncharacterized protein
MSAPALLADRCAPGGPVPFQQYILKVHSRCNLACDHCYMYEAADQSWRGQPRQMSPETVAAVAARAAAHTRRWGLPAVEFVLHGGEPLLLGPARLAEILAVLSAADWGTGVRVSYALQTNGLLLRATVLEVLRDRGVSVAVSLDGDRAANDRHRRYANGRSSYVETRSGIALLRTERYRALFSGLLCTVDVRNDPAATVRAVLAESPPAIDFLLPHATWALPPPGRTGGTGTEYGAWLAAAFDEWYAVRPAGPRVRLFEEILALVLGGQSRSESVGTSPAAMVVVETDGSIQQVDALKVAYQGAPETGLNVRDDTFDDALRELGETHRPPPRTEVSPLCRRCPEFEVCGGGQVTHRYRPENGFDNPSVYCEDLKLLIGHIRRRALSELAGRKNGAWR